MPYIPISPISAMFSQGSVVPFSLPNDFSILEQIGKITITTNELVEAVNLINGTLDADIQAIEEAYAVRLGELDKMCTKEIADRKASESAMQIEINSNKTFINSFYFSFAQYNIIPSTSDKTSLINTMVDTIGTQKCTVFIPKGNYLINGTVIIPENINLVFDNGAYFYVNGSLTINSQFSAPLCQIFKGEGAFSFNEKLNTVGYPEWFETSKSDSLLALTKCISLFPITQLQNRDYYISNTLKIQTEHRTIQGISYNKYKTIENGTTRIILTSGTKTAVQVGYDTQPNSMNDYLMNVTLKNIEICPSVVPTPTLERKYAPVGLLLKFTLYTQIENVRVNEFPKCFAFVGNVYCKVTDSLAFKSSSYSSDDFFYGFYIDGVTTIIGAGGNSSLYLERCNATLGGNPVLSTSHGILLEGSCADTYINNCELIATMYGITVLGNDTQSGNADINITNCICDQILTNGIVLTVPSVYTNINVCNNYIALSPKAYTQICLYINGCKGALSLSDNQLVCWIAPNCYGLWIKSSEGVKSSGNKITSCKNPIVIEASNYIHSNDVIASNGVTSTQGAIYLINAKRCNIVSLINGASSSYPCGVELNGTDNLKNEIDITSINSAICTDKMRINGTPITTTGVISNNIVMGIL